MGEVGDVRQDTLEGKASPEIFMCRDQLTGDLGRMAPREMVLTVRARPDAGPDVEGLFRNTVSGLDPRITARNVGPMDLIRSRSLSSRKFDMMAFTLYSALALALAWIGIYGVVGYSTTLRMSEFGIRIALGASAMRVLRLVIGNSLTLTSIGVVLGLAASWFATSAFAPLLFGVSPQVFALIVFVLYSASFVASYLPARRAAAVDPLSVLRHE